METKTLLLTFMLSNIVFSVRFHYKKKKKLEKSKNIVFIITFVVKLKQFLQNANNLVSKLCKYDEKMCKG